MTVSSSTPLQAFSSIPPSSEEWLTAPRDDLAAYVNSRNISLLLSIDGTHRYFLLNQPPPTLDDQNTPVRVSSFQAYINTVVPALADLFDLHYGLGINTIMILVMLPGDFLRPDNYMANVLEQSRHTFAGSKFQQLYQKYGIMCRLVGDYDVATTPEVLQARPFLQKLQRDLETLTPAPSQQQNSAGLPKKLLLGYYSGTFTEEIIARTAQLMSRQPNDLNGVASTVPTLAELRAACFPYGPTRFDLLIGAGWLRVGAILPPILDGGDTDIYNLSYLALDMREDTARRILYDHLFLRKARDIYDMAYTPQDLAELKEYYAAHDGALVGLGRVVGPGIWYAEHPPVV